MALFHRDSSLLSKNFRGQFFPFWPFFTEIVLCCPRISEDSSFLQCCCLLTAWLPKAWLFVYSRACLVDPCLVHTCLLSVMKPFPHCLDACSFALGVLLVLFHRCCLLVMNLVSAPYPWFMLISSPSKTVLRCSRYAGVLVCSNCPTYGNHSVAYT